MRGPIAILALSAGLAVGAPAVGRTAGIVERQVAFRNGDVELRGTLVLPAAAGPSPAIVFLHGSGPQTRAGFRQYAEEFASIGIAGLLFDKRGTGESGGSWIEASLDDLTGDALAAVGYLKTLGEVDTSRIGFWGISQAGWVAPVAASRSRDIAFMILISGGGASPRESELFSYRSQFEQWELTPAETSRAIETLSAYFDYLASGERRDDVSARIERLGEGRLAALRRQLERILPSEENRSNWSWVAVHDPGPPIRTITCPVLLMFGDRDADHPTPLAVARWREDLARSGNDRVTLMVFPGAGHGIRMRGQHPAGTRAPFADGYREAQIGWLVRHVVNAAR